MNKIFFKVLKALYFRSKNLKTIVLFDIFKKHKKMYAPLKNNKKFFNCHKGERCFILGNGPSLKCEDLTPLADEYVFTVNQASRLPQFKDIKPNYHFWVDPVFFDIDENNPEDVELLNTMISVGDTNPELQCFFPIQQFDFIKLHRIDETMNVNYFYTDLVFFEGYNQMNN